MLFRCFLLLFCLSMAACQDDSGPSPLRYGNPRVLATCVPSGSKVSCTATLYDVPTFGSARDITNEATWLSSNQTMGSFTQSGLFTPIEQGEVGLWVRFDQWEDPDQSWFLVDPNNNSQRLYFLSGEVLDVATEVAIVGAEVRILDGYARNKSAITNENGHYQIDRVLTGENFFIRASKAGYHSQRKSYRVDSPIGPNGNAPFLNFLLRKD